MSKVLVFLHASLIVSDLARARHFYEEILGLTPSAQRPQMSFEGVWYELGAQQIHLLALPNPDASEGRPAHGGRDRHIALEVASLQEVLQTLDAHAIAYTLSQSGRPALFCRDPDGNAIELIQSV